MQAEGVIQIVACLATVLAFRAAAAVPGLAGWQAAAAGATWLFLGGRGSTLAGVLLLVLVLARARSVRVSVIDRGEVRFATLLGSVVAVGAMWSGRAAPFGWAIWLLPVAPLGIDAVGSAAWHWYCRAGSPVRVSALIAEANGRPRAAGTVLFVLGLGWYGVAAWWSRTVEYSVLLTGVVVSVPVVCVWLVVSVAALRAPVSAATAGTIVLGTGSRIWALTGCAPSPLGWSCSRMPV